jgi:ferredoxin
MANLSTKLLENAPGKFYVDSQCIDCDLCRQTAPLNFSRNGGASYSYVLKQPLTQEEETLCEQAKLECPVEAIGNDGE